MGAPRLGRARGGFAQVAQTSLLIAGGLDRRRQTLEPVQDARGVRPLVGLRLLRLPRPLGHLVRFGRRGEDPLGVLVAASRFVARLTDPVAKPDALVDTDGVLGGFEPEPVVGAPFRLDLHLPERRATLLETLEAARELCSAVERRTRRVARPAPRLALATGFQRRRHGLRHLFGETGRILDPGLGQQVAPMVAQHGRPPVELDARPLEPLRERVEAARAEHPGEHLAAGLVVGDDLAKGALREHHGLAELVGVAAEQVLDLSGHLAGPVGEHGDGHAGGVEALEPTLGGDGGGAGPRLLGPLLPRHSGDAEALAARLEVEDHRRRGVRVEVADELGAAAFDRLRVEQRVGDGVEQGALAAAGGAVDEEQPVHREPLEVDLLCLGVGTEGVQHESERFHAPSSWAAAIASRRTRNSSSLGASSPKTSA